MRTLKLQTIIGGLFTIAAFTIITTAGFITFGNLTTLTVKENLNAQLSEDTANLTADLGEAVEQVVALREQHSTLYGEHTTLTLHGQVLTQQTGILKEELTALTTAKETLTAQHTQLMAEQKTLSDRYAYATRVGTINNPHQLKVWTAGRQAEIDRCLGAVDISAWYHTPSVAEHFHCGGNKFPQEVGSYIRITGLNAGLYRNDGIMVRLNWYVHEVKDVPKGQADLIYQTCLNGRTDMGFFKLTRVGD